jgi:23S rRNA (cytosine1962-C5)-methyltransferase
MTDTKTAPPRAAPPRAGATTTPAPAQQAAHPILRLKAGAHRRPLLGHPWIYSNEVAMDAAAKALPPGGIVSILANDGRSLGTAMFNPRPLISARLLSTDPAAAIDADFLAERLGRALALRERLYDAPFYRLVHAEADGLPGTIIDRYGDVVVVQTGTAGMDRLSGALCEALDAVLQPRVILLRSDGAARALEGLEPEERLAKGALDGPVELLENGVRFLADLGAGQKTGWFYDQRENRAAVAALAAGVRVLDLYCYSGGFAVQAAAAGATGAVAVDRSQPALDLAARAAALNGVAGAVAFRREEAFAALHALADSGERFGIVVADPPAFVKSRKDLGQGTRAYRKLARLSAGRVVPGGFLMICSCSHHVTPAAFAEQVWRGLHDAGRQGRILRASGAGADHPIHPALPESAYLKALLLQVD